MQHLKDADNKVAVIPCELSLRTACQDAGRKLRRECPIASLPIDVRVSGHNQHPQLATHAADVGWGWFWAVLISPDGMRLNGVTEHTASGKEAREAVGARAPKGGGSAAAITPRASAHIRRLQARLSFNQGIEGVGDMNTFGSRIFGALIGGTIFFGVGIALAHAGAMVA